MRMNQVIRNIFAAGKLNDSRDKFRQILEEIVFGNRFLRPSLEVDDPRVALEGDDAGDVGVLRSGENIYPKSQAAHLSA
jgi:hypothetical protein